MSETPPKLFFAYWADSSISLVWAPTWKVLYDVLNEDGDPLDVVTLFRIKTGENISSFKTGREPLKHVTGGTRIDPAEMKATFTKLAEKAKEPGHVRWP